MKRQNLSFIPFLLLSAWLMIGQGTPEALADYVVLKSGGRVEGEITEANDQRVTIKVEGLGEIRFEREDIERVEYRQIRRLATDTPPPPPATSTPTPTQGRRFLEPTRAPATTPTNTPKLFLGRQRARPTATPAPPVTQPQPTAARAEREPVERGPEGPPGWPDQGLPMEDLFGGPTEEGYEEGLSWDPREFDEEAFQKQIETVAKGAQLLIYLIVFMFYLYLSLCRHVIATKTDTPNAWWAWIPVLRDILLLRVGDNPAWWAVFLYLGLGIQWFLSFAVDINPFEQELFAVRLAYALVQIIGVILWGIFSYMMWKDVCTARGKAKSTAYLMHMHILFFPALFGCLGCCFLPFVLAGLLCYFVVCPAFIAFYK